MAMFMIDLRTKYHMPTSNCLLITAVKPRTTETFRTTAILFYIQYKLHPNSFSRSVTKRRFRATQ